MTSRLALIAITLFWVTMNALLWRSEFGGASHPGSSIPPGVVWQKILTAPDASELEVTHHGRSIGFCKWSASIEEKHPEEDGETRGGPPEGMISGVTGYRLDFEGSISPEEGMDRLPFRFTSRFDTNHAWQEFRLRLNLRPDLWDISSRVEEQSLRVRSEENGRSFERVITYAQLRNPETLAREFGLPLVLPSLLPGLPGGTAGSTEPGRAILSGLKWEARSDWVTIGHASVRAYRLQARLFDRYRMVVYVSTVGEIIRVEFPDDVLLVNTQLNL